MDKPKVSAKEVLDDIQAGKSNAELMHKYSLSPAGLESLATKLLSEGLIKLSMYDRLVVPSATTVVDDPGKPKIKIDPREVVQDFRSGMDDESIKEKYGLNDRRLHRLFSKLIDAGVLTADELDQRRMTATPEPEIPQPHQQTRIEPTEAPPGPAPLQPSADDTTSDDFYGADAPRAAKPVAVLGGGNRAQARRRVVISEEASGTPLDIFVTLGIMLGIPLVNGVLATLTQPAQRGIIAKYAIFLGGLMIVFGIWTIISTRLGVTHHFMVRDSGARVLGSIFLVGGIGGSLCGALSSVPAALLIETVAVFLALLGFLMVGSSEAEE